MGWDEVAKRFSFGTLGTPLKHADAKAARNQHVHQEKRTNKNSLTVGSHRVRGWLVGSCFVVVDVMQVM